MSEYVVDGAVRTLSMDFRWCERLAVLSVWKNIAAFCTIAVAFVVHKLLSELCNPKNLKQDTLSTL